MYTRIRSLDVLRGIVMVLMAIDHARVFLHEDFYRFNAEDLSKTTPELFFTRWITHFCAPVFILLVGTSTYLLQQKVQLKKKVTWFLVSRGLLLVLLEVTLFRFCWQPGQSFFEPQFSMLVIWAIGISMLFLALLIWLPYGAILSFGLLVLFLHNTLANVQIPEGTGMHAFWAFFYAGGYAQVGKAGIFFLYPVLPYFGLVALGYVLGAVFRPELPFSKRRKILTGLGAGAIILFIILRWLNGYGDPHPWEPQRNGLYTLMAFLRTTKYPVSLDFALMTIGPALLFLAWMEKVQNRITDVFATIGSVPMFYYILHLLLFMLLALLLGFNRFGLGAMYGFFAGGVLLLYVLCRWYAKYKFSHPEIRWMKYL